MDTITSILLFFKNEFNFLIAGLYQNFLASGIKKLPLTQTENFCKKLFPFSFCRNPGFIFSSFFPINLLYKSKGSQIGAFITFTPLGISQSKLSSCIDISEPSAVKITGSHPNSLRYFVVLSHLCTPPPPIGGQ